METLDFTAVTQLVTLIQSAGLSAAVNPEDVNPPGVWVTVHGIRDLSVGGQLQVEAVLYLISGDGDYAHAMDQLAQLYNTLIPGTLIPDDVVSTTGVVLPGNPTPMPALRVPINLI